MDWLKKLGGFLGGVSNQASRTIGGIAGGANRAVQQAQRTFQQPVQRVINQFVPPRQPPRPQFQLPKVQIPQFQLPQAPKINLNDFLRAINQQGQGAATGANMAYRTITGQQLAPNQQQMVRQNPQLNQALSLGKPLAQIPKFINDASLRGRDIQQQRLRQMKENPATFVAQNFLGPLNIATQASDASKVYSGRDIVPKLDTTKIVQDTSGYLANTPLKNIPGAGVVSDVVKPIVMSLARGTDVLQNQEQYSKGLKGAGEFGVDLTNVLSLLYTGGLSKQLATKGVSFLPTALKLAPRLAASGAGQNILLQLSEGKKINEIDPKQIAAAAALYTGLGVGIPGATRGAGAITSKLFGKVQPPAPSMYAKGFIGQDVPSSYLKPKPPQVGKTDSVYHGTTEKIDGDFRYPLYTTPSKDYAQVFAGSTSASSISKSGKKLNDAPMVHEFQVNTKARVLDITNPAHRKLLEEQYFGKYSMSYEPTVGKNGHIDWTEGENLAEWIDKNKLPFDAIKLDEGGGGLDPQFGSKVIDKGVSYMALNKNALTPAAKANISAPQVGKTDLPSMYAKGFIGQDVPSSYLKPKVPQVGKVDKGWDIKLTDTPASYETRTKSSGSAQSVIRQLSYPFDSIQGKLDALGKLDSNKITLEQFKQLYFTDRQLKMAKSYDVQLPTVEQLYKSQTVSTKNVPPQVGKTPTNIYDYNPTMLEQNRSLRIEQATGQSYAEKFNVAPDSKITIYRGVSENAKGKITAGDWVTHDKELARVFARQHKDGSKILAQKVNAGDIRYTADNATGYADGEFVYKPTIATPVAQVGKTVPIKAQAPVSPPVAPKVPIKAADETLLPIYSTKRTSNLDKAFRSTRSIIERQGESGKKLADDLQIARDTKEIYLSELQQKMPTLTTIARKGKNALVNKDFENFVDATQGLAKPKNSQVAQAVAEWQATHPGIRQRALNAGLDVGDLGQTYYPHFIDYEKVFKDKNTYNEAINHLIKTNQAETPEAAIKLLGYARNVSRNREFGNLEASRLVDLPFYDKTPNSLISYLNGSTKRISQVETFGAGDAKALKLIADAGQEGYDTEVMKNAFDVAVGAKRYNPNASKISGGIRKYITTTRLGLGALTNIGQNVNTGVVTGHIRTLTAMAKQFSPKVRQQVADTAVISDALLNDLKTQVGYSSFSSKVLGKVINKITAPLFGTVEKFNRSVAATAGRDYALRLAQKGDIATLQKLGVTGKIGKNLTEAQQIQAARKVVEKTQFKVDPQDLPGWADSPGGKLVAQFRTFSYMQGKFIYEQVLQPASKGNLAPLGRLMAALPVGYALYETKRVIGGRPEEKDKTKVALASFQNIGGAGLVFDLYQSLNPLNSKYIPPDRRISMSIGAFGGPAAGLAAQGIGAVSEALQRKNTPADLSRLEGKLAVAKNDNTYTDLTSLARFGLQQIPVVGTPIKNRLLPFKKEAEADVGSQKIAEFSKEESREKTKETIRIKQALEKGDTSVLEGLDKTKAASIIRAVAEDKAKKDMTPTQIALFNLPKNQLQSIKETGQYEEDIKFVERVKDSLSAKKPAKIKLGARGKLPKARKGRKGRAVARPKFRKVTVTKGPRVRKVKQASFAKLRPTKSARKTIKIKS